MCSGCCRCRDRSPASVLRVDIVSHFPPLAPAAVSAADRDPAPSVLQVAYNTLRVGGLLIFADRVFDARWTAYLGTGGPPQNAEAYGEAGDESPAGATAAARRVLRSGRIFWDVGHPCTVKQAVLDHFLLGFEELHMQRFTKPSSKPGQAADEQLYFIGRKLRPAER